MKFAFQKLRKFLISHYSSNMYLPILALASLLIFLNYWFEIDNKLSINYAYKPQIYFAYTVRNLFCFYSSVFIVLFASKNKVKKIKEFLLVSFIGIIIYSIYSKFYSYNLLVVKFPFQTRYYIHYLFSNLNGLITLTIPLLFIWAFQNKNTKSGFYGLHFKHLNNKRYLDIYIIIIIIIFIGSFMGSITEYYPMLKYTFHKSAALQWNIPSWLTAMGFELSYAFDFVMVELFFRGFLIIGLMKYLGKDVILPMIVLYAVIHFGKPLPETISSLFGGYILGVLAYEQKHIRTGIYFHLALALGMELFAYLRLTGVY